jgi:hypothetical protein
MRMPEPAVRLYRPAAQLTPPSLRNSVEPFNERDAPVGKCSRLSPEVGQFPRLSAHVHDHSGDKQP